MITYGPGSTVHESDGNHHIWEPIKIYHMLSHASDIDLWRKYPSNANNSQLVTYGGDYVVIKRKVSWLSNRQRG